jgi:hypothetical protein
MEHTLRFPRSRRVIITTSPAGGFDGTSSLQPTPTLLRGEPVAERLDVARNWDWNWDWRWWPLLRWLLIMYLFSCMWSIVVAVKDAVLRALQPLFTLWSLMRWLFGDW